MPGSAGAVQIPNPQRVVLIRHGETEWSKSGRHTSRTDLALTATGERQAKSLATLIAGLGLRDPLVVSSPRQRATRTAELAGLRISHTWDALAEWEYGDYEGLTTEQIRKKTAGWTVWTHRSPGGETAQAVGARANRAIAVAEDQLTNRDVIFVGHGHFSCALLARWAELPVAEGRRFVLSAGAMSVLGFTHDVRVIVCHNIGGER